MEYIIGRASSDGMVKVPATCDRVSGTHARITVDDYGTWTLEDLDSKNGTFVRDDNGEFQRVYRKQISKKTVIRLGSGGSGCFVFTAGHVQAPEPDNYEYEFHQMKKLLRAQQDKEQKKEKAIERNGWIAKFSGFGVIGICALLGSIKGVDIDPTMRYILISSAPVVVGLLFKGDAAALKSLRRKRDKIIVCPRCERPLSEFDVEHCQCSRCKAR